MKLRSLLLAFCLLGTLGSYAQKGELSKGKNSYVKFNEVKEVGTPALGIKDLETAKASLEKAAEHKKTQDLSETWAMLALVYADYVTIDSVKADEYTAKALEAIEKAKSLEGHEEQEQNLEVAIRVLAQTELTQGVQNFDKQDYSAAYKNFEKGLEYLPGDTLFAYYGGLAAINAKEYPAAINLYKDLLKNDEFSTVNQIYLDISRLYMMQNDTVSAIKYAEEGAEKFPDFAELVIQKIELNLQAGNEDKVIADISKQIEKDPTNKYLYYYSGIAYGSSDDDENAEKAYKKAIEIDKDFSDAYVNLGGLMLNKGIKVFREASALPTSKQKEYNEALKVGNQLIEEALPFLIKATETDTKSAIALQNLKTYYQLKEDEDKVKEIEEKMNAL